MSTPSVKITRQGIEVLEVPTDVSALEARVSAIEQNDSNQDVTLVSLGGKVAAVESNVLINQTRLGDIQAVDEAIAALHTLTSLNTVNIASLTDAVTALEANAHTEVSLVAVNQAISDLQATRLVAGNLTTLEDAVAALNTNVAALQTASLTTASLIPLNDAVAALNTNVAALQTASLTTASLIPLNEAVDALQNTSSLTAADLTALNDAVDALESLNPDGVTVATLATDAELSAGLATKASLDADVTFDSIKVNGKYFLDKQTLPRPSGAYAVDTFQLGANDLEHLVPILAAANEIKNLETLPVKQDLIMQVYIPTTRNRDETFPYVGQNMATTGTVQGTDIMTDSFWDWAYGYQPLFKNNYWTGSDPTMASEYAAYGQLLQDVVLRQGADWESKIQTVIDHPLTTVLKAKKAHIKHHYSVYDSATNRMVPPATAMADIISTPNGGFPVVFCYGGNTMNALHTLHLEAAELASQGMVVVSVNNDFGATNNTRYPGKDAVITDTTLNPNWYDITSANNYARTQANPLSLTGRSVYNGVYKYGHMSKEIMTGMAESLADHVMLLEEVFTGGELDFDNSGIYAISAGGSMAMMHVLANQEYNNTLPSGRKIPVIKTMSGHSAAFGDRNFTLVRGFNVRTLQMIGYTRNSVLYEGQSSHLQKLISDGNYSVVKDCMQISLPGTQHGSSSGEFLDEQQNQGDYFAYPLLDNEIKYLEPQFPLVGTAQGEDINSDKFVPYMRYVTDRMLAMYIKRNLMLNTVSIADIVFMAEEVGAEVLGGTRKFPGCEDQFQDLYLGSVRMTSSTTHDDTSVTNTLRIRPFDRFDTTSQSTFDTYTSGSMKFEIPMETKELRALYKPSYPLKIKADRTIDFPSWEFAPGAAYCAGATSNIYLANGSAYLDMDMANNPIGVFATDLNGNIRIALKVDLGYTINEVNKHTLPNDRLVFDVLSQGVTGTLASGLPPVSIAGVDTDVSDNAFTISNVYMYDIKYNVDGTFDCAFDMAVTLTDLVDTPEIMWSNLFAMPDTTNDGTYINPTFTSTGDANYKLSKLTESYYGRKFALTSGAFQSFHQGGVTVGSYTLDYDVPYIVDGSLDWWCPGTSKTIVSGLSPSIYNQVTLSGNIIDSAYSKIDPVIVNNSDMSVDVGGVLNAGLVLREFIPSQSFIVAQTATDYFSHTNFTSSGFDLAALNTSTGQALVETDILVTIGSPEPFAATGGSYDMGAGTGETVDPGQYNTNNGLTLEFNGAVDIEFDLYISMHDYANRAFNQYYDYAYVTTNGSFFSSSGVIPTSGWNSAWGAKIDGFNSDPAIGFKMVTYSLTNVKQVFINYNRNTTQMSPMGYDTGFINIKYITPLTAIPTGISLTPPANAIEFVAVPDDENESEVVLATESTSTSGISKVTAINQVVNFPHSIKARATANWLGRGTNLVAKFDIEKVDDVVTEVTD